MDPALLNLDRVVEAGPPPMPSEKTEKTVPASSSRSSVTTLVEPDKLAVGSIQDIFQFQYFQSSVSNGHNNK